MSLLRPEATLALRRWAEPAAALLVALAGLWSMARGGYFFAPLGLGLLALGLGWLRLGLRRIRFTRQQAAAPGLVEIDEGQVGYLGPSFGGYLALRDLTEVRLIRLHGHPHWRLKQGDGQALLIPHGAAGADQLFEAFATLPGADMAAFADALDQAADTRTVWTRPARLAAPHT